MCALCLPMPGLQWLSSSARMTTTSLQKRSGRRKRLDSGAPLPCLGVLEGDCVSRKGGRAPSAFSNQAAPDPPPRPGLTIVSSSASSLPRLRRCEICLLLPRRRRCRCRAFLLSRPQKTKPGGGYHGAPHRSLSAAPPPQLLCKPRRRGWRSATGGGEEGSGRCFLCRSGILPGMRA